MKPASLVVNRPSLFPSEPKDRLVIDSISPLWDRIASGSVLFCFTYFSIAFVAIVSAVNCFQ